MTATNHGMFGAFIAVGLQAHPVIAAAVAPWSHFLLDALPHYGDARLDLRGRKFFTILAIDALLAVVSTLIVAVFWSEIALLVIGCAFLAASPDLMWIYYQYLRPDLSKKHQLARFHSWIQWSQTPKGFLFEVVWFTLFFSLLILFGVRM